MKNLRLALITAVFAVSVSLPVQAAPNNGCTIWGDLIGWCDKD